MTKKRNFQSDQLATNRVLTLTNSGQLEILDQIPNWLGHSAGSARLDKLLVLGATFTELENIRGAIKEHFRHLRDEHGLKITQFGSKYRISL